MEEYERTGQAKVTNLNDSNNDKDTNSNNNTNSMNLSQQSTLLNQQSANTFSLNQQSQAAQAQQQSLQSQQQQQQQSSQLQLADSRPTSQPSSIASNDRSDMNIKSEPMDEMMNEIDMKNDAASLEYELQQYRQQQQLQQSQQQQSAQNLFFNNFETKSESGSSDILSRPQTPNSLYSNINEMISQQIDSIPINNISNLNNMNQMGPPKKFQLNKIFDKSYESNSNSSNSSTSSGKRANRTRFTDYQIKVLQEFFENNSYPKDSDLEYLSKLLLLSPRVIVVWFQVRIF